MPLGRAILMLAWHGVRSDPALDHPIELGER
jgi:hypothetical protein